MGGAVASIRLSVNWDDARPKNDDEINKLALHEILHLLMAEYYSQAEARFTTQDSMEMTEHFIIRRLEGVLL